MDPRGTNALATDWVEAFAATLPQDLQAAGRAPDVQRALEDLWQRGAQAWPELSSPLPDFAAHVALTTPAGVDLQDYIGGLCAADVSLAAAVARGRPGAVEAFDRIYTELAGRVLGQAVASQDVVDEIRQHVRERVVSGSGGRRPAIETYSGRGSLKQWLRVSLLREVYRTQTERQRWADLDEADDPAAAGDTELQYMKRVYGPEFRRAVTKALGTLTPKQRNLLRFVYVEGLSVGRVASLYGVHRVSASRWLGDTRRRVAEETRRLVRERLQLSPSETDSVLRLLESELEISLGPIL